MPYEYEDEYIYSSNNNIDIEQYIKDKIDLMTDRRGFNIKLKESEIKYMEKLTTVTAVDNFAKDMFDKYL